MLSLVAPIFPDLRPHTDDLFFFSDFYCDVDAFVANWFKCSALQQRVALFVRQSQTFKTIGTKPDVVLHDNAAYLSIRGLNQMRLWLIISKAVTEKEEESVFASI